MATKFSEGVLARRLKGSGGAPGAKGKFGGTPAPPPVGAGKPGPRGGKKKLAPSNTAGAGSLFKKGQPGRMFKGLQNAKNPR